MRIWPWLHRVALLCLLAACGGGGGGNDGNASGNRISLDVASLAIEVDGTKPVVGRISKGVTATFRGAGVAVALPPGSPSLPSWLSINPGTSSGNAVSFNIEVDPSSSALGIGRHVFTLRFATGNADASGVVYVDLPLTVTVIPSVWPAAVSLHAVTDGAPVTEDVYFDWAGLAWTPRANVPWITLVREAVPPSVGADRVRVTLNPAGLAEGEHRGLVYLEETAGHVAREVPVTLLVEKKRLVVRQRGVALSEVGARRHLQASLPIDDNAGGQLAWAAAADQPWLQLGAASGGPGTSLELTASPTGLADGLHQASVTVTPQGAVSASDAVVVRVGLYVKRGLVPAVRTSVPMRSRSSPSPVLNADMAADPIRPYAYRAEGDGRIDIYNIHSATLDAFIPVPAHLGALAVSDDGSRLFAVHAVTGDIYVIDLASRAVTGSWTGFRVATHLAWTEVNGQPVLLTSELQAIDASTGALLADGQATSTWRDTRMEVVARRDGRAAYFQTSSNGNHRIFRYALSRGGGTFTLQRTHDINETGDAAGIAIDRNDAVVYSASSGVAQGGVSVYDGAALVPQRVVGVCCGSLFVKASPDGSIYAASWSANGFRRYPAGGDAGTVTYDLGTSPMSLLVAGHGTRVVMSGSAGGSGYLYFQDVP